MGKYELHLHTSNCDKAAHLDGAEAVRLYAEKGYAGMVVTDHYFSLFQEWFSHELRGVTHHEYIHRWLRGYYAARNEGEKIGFTVLPGAEVRFDGSINDYLLYGVTEEFFYEAPYLHQLKGLHELQAILPKEACVVQAHPFRNHMTVMDPTPLFGLETYNGNNEPIRNDLAKLYALHYKKPMTSGSDCHHADHVARGGIETDLDIRTPEDLARVLKSGAYRLIGQENLP